MLIVIAAIGFVGYIVSWVQAYHKVENIDKWPKQMEALNPWWFLSANLLNKEHEHIRYRAIKLFVLFALCLLALWKLN